MVPWTHLREPPLWGKCLTDLTSEFTHFNLVIRRNSYSRYMPIGARIDHGPGMA